MSPELYEHELLQGRIARLGRALRKEMAELLGRVGPELGADLSALLEQFTDKELAKFVTFCVNLESPLQTAFVSFVLTGDIPDSTLLIRLDSDENCQEAVDLAFTAHTRGIGDVKAAMREAERALRKSREIPLSFRSQPLDNDTREEDGTLCVAGDVQRPRDGCAKK